MATLGGDERFEVVTSISDSTADLTKPKPGTRFLSCIVIDADIDIVKAFGGL
jgi:hypothetical protein